MKRDLTEDQLRQEVTVALPLSGLLRQSPSSHHARALLAKLLLLQRFSVNHHLTKVYKPRAHES